MKFEVFTVSRFDESERPYVSTTCPSPDRLKELVRQGYQVTRSTLAVPSIRDVVPEAPVTGSKAVP